MPYLRLPPNRRPEGPIPMRWVWTLAGWRLRGTVLPEPRPQCGRWPADR